MPKVWLKHVRLKLQIGTGEKVIVDGIAKVKEGATVVAKPYQPQTAAPQGAGQPAADANKAGQPAGQAQPKTEQKATSNA